jgi:hypothetical protein
MTTCGSLPRGFLTTPVSRSEKEEIEESLSMTEKATDECMKSLEQFIAKKFEGIMLRIEGKHSTTTISLVICVPKFCPKSQEIRSFCAEIEDNIAYPSIVLSVKEE